MARTSLIRLPLEKRAAVFAVLDKMDPPVPLCVCCRHSDQDRDKNDRPWLTIQVARNARNQLREQCRRCGGACANARCAELPPNIANRGYGLVPKPSGIRRLFG
jgi:uncharacterized protein (DUF58 family)